jgi:membrane protein DedA with SNARE-associated domain
MADTITDFLTLAATNPALVVLAVALATFVLEDAATVGSALLAAEGVLPVPAAVLGLFIGITLGDMGLFGIGALARRWRWLAARIGERRLARGQAWLEGRLIPAILLARVTPGLRVPCYSASGYLGISFFTFAAVAVLAVAVWSVAAFTLVYFYGQVAQAWLGKFSWVAGAALLALVIGWPHLVRLRSTS